MGIETGISWCDSTWNPIRGCSAVSPGCKNCYAARVAKRFSGPGKPFEGLVRINAKGERTDDWSGQLRFVEEHLLDPLKWGPAITIKTDAGGNNIATVRPRRIFVNSVSDLFHEKLSNEQITRIFAVMALCPQHVFQVLTKRPHRMADYFLYCDSAVIHEAMIGFEAQKIHLARTKEPVLEWSALPMPNVLLGTSVENQEWANKRLKPMADLSAAGWRTFVSYEPALGPVNWQGWEFLDWLISGAESQTGARPSHPDWHRQARDFGTQYGIPYFFKQWGCFAPFSDAPRQGDRIVLSDPYNPYNRYDKNGEPEQSDAWNKDLYGSNPQKGDNGFDTAAMRPGTPAANGHLLDGHEYRAFPVMP